MAGQQHLDRLSAIDAAFLAQEKPNTHMHIGGLALFEGEPPDLDEFLAHIESRLHLVPRYQGDGDLAVLIRGVRIASMHGFINNDWAAGCGFVARYRAPGPPRPHRPGRLKARRSHGTVTVRWARLKDADGYTVRVTGSDGRKELHFLSRKRRRVRILTVAPATRLKVRVAGWHGIRSIAGPARAATVRAQKAKKPKKPKKQKKR
jgi:hypothetical protein